MDTFEINENLDMHLPKTNDTKMEIAQNSSQLRAMTCECSVLTRPDGSCVFNQGDTSVMAAIYGPTEVRANRERLDRAYVEITFKPKIGMAGCVEHARERVIRNTCEATILVMLHPRTAINIILQELQNSGSLLSNCINAACMALLNAAVPLKYLVAAVSCVIDEKDSVILDPTDKQEAGAVTSLTFVFSSNDHKVVCCETTGQCTQEQYHQCLLACMEASNGVFKFYRRSMEKQLSHAF